MAKRQKKIVNEPMEVKQYGSSNATKNKPITKESFANFANAFKSGFQDVSDAFSFSGGSKQKPKVSNASVSPDVMRKEQLAQRRQQAAKAPAKNTVASSLKGNNGGSVKSSAKDTAYRNMANRKAQAAKQNTAQTQPKKTFNANEAMAQRRAAAQAQGKGNWNANEEMKRRREEAQKKKAYQNAFGGKGK